MEKTFKVVINGSYGGFRLSNKAWEWMIEKGLDKKYYYELTSKPTDDWEERYYQNEEIPRHHPLLVECVETLGSEASGMWSRLVVCEITSNMYRIDEYDGSETIETPEDLDWITIEE